MATDEELKRIVIEEEDTPGILYHYTDWKNDNHKNTDWKNDNHKKLISTPEIYLANADSFNDPYDCGIVLRYDLWSEEAYKDAYRQLLETHRPPLTRAEIENNLQSNLSHYRKDPKAHCNQIQERNDKIFKENVGVFCFSEIWDNMLMWSHYADSHKGICIGYKTHELEECVQEHLVSLDPSSKWIHYLKVRYRENYPIIRPSTDMKDHRDFIKRLRTKYLHWKYELEWRLTVGFIRGDETLDEQKRTVKIPIDAIAEIYLGLDMLPRHELEIIKELKGLEYKGDLFKIRKIDYSYHLRYDKLEL